MSRTITRTIAAAGLGLASIALITPAQAASPDAGLFGAGDPTYDGAFRQSMSILALAPLGKVPAQAITWLQGQQCLDGTFEAYRASIRTACAVPDPEKFTGADSNSTALGAMALRAARRTPQADKSIAALVKSQNTDGGWGYTLGSASDVNSTGLVLAALNGAPKAAATTAANRKARSYLASSQVPCTGVGTFGLPYQAGGKADAFASAQALMGIAGTIPIAGSTTLRTTATAACSSPMQTRIAAYLNQALATGHGLLPSALDATKTDWNTTASAVLGLAAAKLGKGGVTAGLGQLQTNVTAYAGAGTEAKPAALANLIMVAQATGQQATAFGTPKTNLVSSLTTSMRK